MRLRHQLLPGESGTQPVWVTHQEQSWCLVTCSGLLLPNCVSLCPSSGCPAFKMGWIRTQKGRETADCISKQLPVLSGPLLPLTLETRVLGGMEGSVSCGCQPQGWAELGKHGASLSKRLSESKSRKRGEALLRPHPLLTPRGRGSSHSMLYSLQSRSLSQVDCI